jgi:eukaryotic-like serine/threonine-protein kinase
MNETGVVEGQVLGRYELLLRVAQGGMARVWAARLHGTRGFRKLVAVKTILPNVMEGERLEQMFLEEATLASGIHHPNVVDTLELGEQDGVLFMVLEWVDGEPLSFLMQEAVKIGGIPLPLGVNLIAQACKGLHAAHELCDETGALLGVVHRDISPHNILVTFSGIAKVVDFGIAKATQRASSLTEAGEIKGKLAYMAPEQIRGRAVDRRTDVFALGTLLYVITTGRHPWKRDNPGATTERLVSDRPVKPPSALRPDYPAALDAVVRKALEKDPDKRFATAADLLVALEEAVPSSLEGNAEARIAEFMQKLAGPRGVERRKQIRLAGDLLDQRRALSGVTVTGTGSSASTRGLAVDASSSSSRMSAVGELGENATPSVHVQRSHLDKFVWVGVAAAFAGCLGFVARRELNQSEPASRAAAAVLVDARAPAVPLPTVTQTVASAAAPAVASAEPEPEAEADGKTKRRARSAARWNAPVAALPAQPAPQPSSTAVAAEVPRPTPVPTTTTAAPKSSSGNAWNPETFGNRY